MNSRAVLLLSAAVLLAAGPGAATEVTAPTGNIQIGAAAKFLYGHSKRDDDTLNPGREDLTTSLVDLTVNGGLGDKVSYMIEIAGSWNQDMGTGIIGMRSSPNETGAVGIRQACIKLTGIVPWTTVTLGTFIPPITNYMPRPVTQLDLIQYPLLNNGSRMDTGMFGNRPAARDFSTWQQTGVNFHVELPYMIQFDIGNYDGMMPGMLGDGDQNIANATNIVMSFLPVDELKLSLAFWGEEFQPGNAFPGISPGAKKNLTIWYLYGAYTTDLLIINADFAQGLIPAAQLDTSGTEQDLTWEAAQVTAGYWIVPTVQILGRYEYLDPNTKDSVKIPASRNDQSDWFTLGVNWLVAEHAELSLNYVWKWEDGIFIDAGRAGEDPNLPNYNPKFSAQRNNLLLVQLQVWN